MFIKCTVLWIVYAFRRWSKRQLSWSSPKLHFPVNNGENFRYSVNWLPSLLFWRSIYLWIILPRGRCSIPSKNIIKQSELWKSKFWKPDKFNASAQNAFSINMFLAKSNIPAVDHPPYSLDIGLLSVPQC